MSFEETKPFTVTVDNKRSKKEAAAKPDFFNSTESGGTFIPGTGLVIDNEPRQQQVIQPFQEQHPIFKTQQSEQVRVEDEQPEQIDVPEQEEAESQPLNTPKPRSAAGELSFRKIREDRDAKQAEIARLQQELEMARRYQQPQQYQQQQQAYHAPEEEIDMNFGDEDLVEGKTIKKMYAAITAQNRAANQRYQQELAYTQRSAAQLRLRSRFPDYDQVMTDGNIKDFEAKEPDLARSIGYNPDFESQAVSAYTAIKNLGIYEEDPYMAQKERMKTNLAKPKIPTGSNAGVQSPLAQAPKYYDGQITPEIAARARKQVADAKRAL